MLFKKLLARLLGLFGQQRQIERDVAMIGKNPPQKTGLPGLACSSDDHGGPFRCQLL